MIRLGVVGEGQTEREFVDQVLAGHLRDWKVEPATTVMRGNVSVQRLARAMADLYPSFDVVTSLVDFYGFRDKGTATVAELENSVLQQMRSHIRRVWDERKVIPYVQKHEFEALLFADTKAFVEIRVPPERVEQLAAIRSRFEPEDIDDNPDTAPSKRIAAIVPGYDKVVDGVVVASKVGVQTMRDACPGFHAWLTRLEALGSSDERIAEQRE